MTKGVFKKTGCYQGNWELGEIQVRSEVIKIIKESQSIRAILIKIKTVHYFCISDFSSLFLFVKAFYCTNFFSKSIAVK